MQKIYLVSLLVFISSFLFAQDKEISITQDNESSIVQDKEISIIYEGDNTCLNSQSLIAYQFNGVLMDKVGFLNKTDSVSFEFKLPAGNEQFYYVGSAANNAKPVILGKEEKVVLKGNCKSFRAAIVKESDLNKEYARIRDEMQSLNQEGMTIARQIRSAQGDTEQLKTVSALSKALDDKKLDLLLNTAEKQPYLGKIIALNTYLSFQNNGTDYQNEYDYYANEFFQHVNWKDEDYQQNAWVFESVKGYAETISMFNYPLDVHQQLLEGLLAEIPPQSHTYQLALAAIINGLQSKESANLTIFGQQFVDKYKNTSPAAAKAINSKIASSRSFIIGAEAPDFTQATPEGDALSLSDLKGKVVLVDFWASWCGPCRRENPNVVKVYEKYKDQGFEILGVSLDQKRDRWLGAIEQDKLTWKQVSDLKGWANEAAQMYSVRSIPSTVLIDEEGKIIARNLRGPALEQKLKEIFAARSK